jgi:4-carboxymuconolactone decarboxylase
MNTFRTTRTIGIGLLLPVLAGAQSTIERPGGARPVSLATPRIGPLPEARWTDVERRLAETYAPGRRAGNDLRTLLNVPEMVEGLMPFNAYVSKDSSLLPRHRELLILRTAWVCGNQYVWSTHAEAARSAGLTAADIRRVAQGPDAAGWTPLEATLLRAADQLYRNASLNTTTWQALSADYDLFHAMDAVMTVSDFITLSIMYNAFGVQPDAGNVERLPADVPYRVVVPEPEPALTTARLEPLEGTGLGITRTFARYPKLAAPRALNSQYVNQRSKLQPRHREILILRTGWNCRSEYEWAQHVGSVGQARKYGLDPIRIAEGPNAPVWDPFESTLLRAADEIYRDATISDSTWRQLSTRFDQRQMMDVVVTASNYRMVSTALNALGVQMEPADERFPPVVR